MMHMRRNGQAALEFLTTYGWAILIVLVMTAAFAYFGILNPSKLMPERCGGSPEFLCVDYNIDTGVKTNAMMIFSQTIGKTIYVTNVTCAYADGAPKQAAQLSVDGVVYTPNTNTGWSPRAKMEVKCDDIGIPVELQGEKVKVMYVIEYKKSTAGLLQVSEGEMVAQVQ